jgi:multiple sugar transport system permease protein
VPSASRSERLLRPLGALVVCLIVGVPLAVMVAGALNPPGDPLPRGLGIVPLPPSTESLSRAGELVDLGTQFRNSVLVAAVAVPLSLLVAALAGFALARLPERQRRLGVAAVLALLVVPASAVWMPRVVGAAAVGIDDTLIPLVLPALLGTTPFAVLLFLLAFRRLPESLFDAARLEGLTPLQTWRRVGMPLVRPTTAAIGLLVFVLHWGAFVDPLLYLRTPDRYTLPLGLNQLRLLAPGDQSTVLAGALVVVTPVLVAFALAQRRLFRELT